MIFGSVPDRHLAQTSPTTSIDAATPVESPGGSSVHPSGPNPIASGSSLPDEARKGSVRKEAGEILSDHRSLRAGMPHLDVFGLSEMFCLATAGDCHWSLISAMTSKPPIEWKNHQEKRIYASFVYTSISYSRLIDVSEGDIVQIECTPLSLNAPFFITETKYTKSSSDIVARVKLMSVFVTRHKNDNSQFVRSSLPLSSNSFGECQLDETKMRYKEIYNYDDGDLKEMADHKVNPSVDFNAAQFMYFANYCHLFKRYESPELSSSVPIKSREIAYFANVDPFERVVVHACHEGMKVRSAMTRSSDQRCIARSHSVNFRA